MDTTPQPAIGSPEWARSLPPTALTSSDVTFTGTHVWTDDKGNVKGRIDLGGVTLTFRAPGQVRDLIGHLALLAGEMDAEIRRQQPPGPFGPDDSAWGKTLDAIEAFQSEPDEPVCGRCGATREHGVLVTADGVTRCYNHPRCDQRAAARDAETVKVTR